MRQRRRTLKDALGPALAEQRTFVSDGTELSAVERISSSAKDAPESTNLKDKLGPLVAEQRQSAENMSRGLARLQGDARRVAELMPSAPGILEELGKQFRGAINLARTDVIVLFSATRWQCLRRDVFASDHVRLEANEGDH